MKKFEKRPGFKFIEAHVSHKGDDCLIWPYSCCTAGYGSFGLNYKVYLAHREMCIRAHGLPPKPHLHAAHSCGNRKCVNPNHLSWKTPSENQLDRDAHGTKANGWRGKLTEAQATEIRSLKGKEKSVVTAERFGVTESNVRLIQDGKIWKTLRAYRRMMPDETVRKIRKIGYTKTLDEMAEMFGVGVSMVNRVRTGRSYRDVT